MLTKLRAALVCEKALCSYAQLLGLGAYLLLGKGEQRSGGAERPSILADAFEAVIAAIYLDGGLEPVRAFILPYLEQEASNQRRRHFKDYKTTLQEIIQHNPEERLDYVLKGRVGAGSRQGVPGGGPLAFQCHRFRPGPQQEGSRAAGRQRSAEAHGLRWVGPCPEPESTGMSPCSSPMRAVPTGAASATSRSLPERGSV